MIKLSLLCDRCGAEAAHSAGKGRMPAHLLRRLAKAKGWSVGGFPGSRSDGLDYCPECLGQMKATARRVAAAPVSPPKPERETVNGSEETHE